MRDQHALGARDDTDAGDEAGADGVVGAPRRQRRQLEERRVAVEQQLDALAGEQLAPLAMPLDVALATPGNGQRLLFLHDGDALEHPRAIGREEVGPLVDFRVQYAQRAPP